MRSLLIAITACLNAICYAQPPASSTTQQKPASSGQAAPQLAPQTQVNCSNLTPAMQQFAAQLTTANQRFFCEQFNDTQRVSCMQMASQQNVNGTMMMTPDQAVQKTAAANNMIQQKTPTGCPVK